MNLLLSSVSASALMGNITPNIPKIKWSTNLPTGYTLDETETQFISTTSTGQRWVYSDKVLGDVVPKNSFKGFYWEIEFTGPSTSGHNSYIGVMKESNAGVYTFPQDISWRGNGYVYLNGSSEYYIGDYSNTDRLMFCFNPYTAEMWFGKNGVWNRDPLVDEANLTGHLSTYIVSAQSRFGGGNGGILHSTEEAFEYTMPVGMSPLAEAIEKNFPTTSIENAKSFVITGRNPSSLLLKHSKTFVVSGGSTDHTLLKQSKTFVILE